MPSDTAPASIPNPASTRSRLILPGYGLLFALVSALFFLWALPNNLNDILIRQFMTSFVINRFQAGLVQSAFYLGYFLFAMPAAILMRRRGYKAGLLTGLLLFAAGSFLFSPAALTRSYAFFLLALFVIASGLSFLETGSNSFIAHLGDASRSEQRLNLAQSFNPLGSITAAWIGTHFILSGVELTPAQAAAEQRAGTYRAYLRHETLRVMPPYMVIGAVLLLMAVLLARMRFPPDTDLATREDTPNPGRLRDLWRQRHLKWAVLAQFFYVGAQVGTWSYTIAYVQAFTPAGEKTAGYVLTLSLVLFAIGRFVSTWLLRYVPAGKLMGLFALINIALLGVVVLHPAGAGLALHFHSGWRPELAWQARWSGVDALAASSFFMSLMFPTIFAMGVKNLGPLAKLGGSVIIMAIIGGAVLTPIMGWISLGRGGMAAAMLVPLACYVFISWFSFRGSPARRPAEVH